MARYVFVGLSMMWVTVFYQNCTPRNNVSHTPINWTVPATSNK